MNALTTKDERLQPAPAIEIAAAMDKLFLTFDTKGPDDIEQQRKLLVIYVEALSKYPIWAVNEAVMKFIRAEVKPASKKFAPKPPEISEVCQGIMEEYALARSKERALEEKQREAKREAEAPSALTQAERERMLFKMQLLRIAAGSAPMIERLQRVGTLGHAQQIPVLIGLAEAWGVAVPENIREMAA